MTTEAPQASQDLAAARELLDKLDASTRGADTDSQATAITAAAHSILVLAEQVAAIRVLMFQDALSRRAVGQPASGTNGQPAAQDGNTPQPASQGEYTSQPAPQGTQTRRKRWW